MLVSELTGFQAAVWNEQAADLDTAARSYDQLAADLVATSQRVGTQWPDQIGQMISAQLVEQSAQCRELPPLMTSAAVRVRSGGQQLEELRARILQVISWAAKNQVLIRDDGSTDGPFPFSLVARGACRQLLSSAQSVDASCAAALAALADFDYPHVDFGPLDLDDEGINEQIDLNAQGSRGDCVLLTTITSIARSDPEFIRQHVVYDPDTGTYHVTLYDPDTHQPVTVEVDPRTMPDGLSGTPTTTNRQPTIASLYEAAIEQQFGQTEHFNYETAPSLVTGRPAVERPASDTSFDEIRQTMDGPPKGAVQVATVNPVEQQPADVPDDKRIVYGHSYSVKGFDDQGRIILQNPWGPAGGMGSDDKFYPGEIRLTADEYRRWMGGVGQLPGPFS